MKINKTFIAITLMTIISGCTFPYEILITNLHDTSIQIRFGLYDAPEIEGVADSTVFSFYKGEQKIIETMTYYFNDIHWDHELRLIEVKDSIGNIYYNRLSTGLIEALDFKLIFPFENNASALNYDILNESTMIEEISRDIYMKYIKSQFYYNLGNHGKCLREIETINFNKELEKLTTEKYEHSTLSDDLQGIILIGLLSSIKDNQVELSKKYFKLLEKNYKEFHNFIIKGDPEIIELMKNHLKNFV